MRAGVRYGILGGTFDPPHLGHLALAQEAHARLGLDRVWFMPAASPPHKRGQPMTPAAQRRAMVELAIADDSRFGLEAVDLERPGPSYTAETLRLLRERWGPSAWLGFIVGWDMLLSLPTWREPEAVVGRLDALIAAHRPDAPGPETLDAGVVGGVDEVAQRLPGLREKLIPLAAPQLGVSSTDLRERVAMGLPVRFLTPDPVCAYIARQGLYRRP